MAFVITADRLDQALANVSDVPTVRVEDGTPVIVFSGNYGAPVNDLVDFLGHLQSLDETLAEAAREGLYWQDGNYGGYATATLNGLTVDGTSRYDEDTETA